MSRAFVKARVPRAGRRRRSLGLRSFVLAPICVGLLVFAWGQIWPTSYGSDLRDGARIQGIGTVVAEVGPAVRGSASSIGLVAEPSSSTSGGASQPPMPSKVVPSGDQVWLARPKTSRSLARDFALAPMALRVDQLVRHEDLNPADQVIDQESMARLEDLLTKHKALLKDGYRRFGNDRHALLKELEQSGALRELTLDMLPAEDQKAAELSVRRSLLARGISSETAVKDELNRVLLENVKGTAAFMMKDGRTFVATREQLRGLQSVEDYTEYLRAQFMYEVLTWFIASGFTSDKAVAHIVEEFQKLVKEN